MSPFLARVTIFLLVVLEWAYGVTLSSLLRAEQEVLVWLDNEEEEDPPHHTDAETADAHSESDSSTTNKDTTTTTTTTTTNEKKKKEFMFGGCSSFMESNSGYPLKYKLNGTLVGRTKALSTNILYYNGYYYAYRMGQILMENTEVVARMKAMATKLKRAIRQRLWDEQRGLYGYFEDETGRHVVNNTEGLGMALVLLSEDFETNHRRRMIFSNTYRTELGLPSVWPRFDLGTDTEDDIHDYHHISERYHNGRIWPCKLPVWVATMIK